MREEGNDGAAVQHAETSSSTSKLGLALSGGGFRAAFFHIGVLARMAEQGLLKEVEVISTVSGGSIIGGLYYLHVKKLLENTVNNKIKDDHYVEIIKKIECDFLTAVEKNIRLQAFKNIGKNLKMVWSDNYSRSDRMAELYDEHFYRAFYRDYACSNEQKQRKNPVEMRELKIRPIMKNGEKAVAFNPDEDNRKLDAKVPVLLINATTLNTGHNWRFESIRMGEPPRANAREKEIDKNIRLRRPKRYEDLPEDLQDTWLGDAVAASACVPGIFPPLAIRGLYEWDKSHKVNGTNKESVVVQLVDGGVHDNQGLEALWDRECERIIVSDASGQLDDDPDPGNRALAALMRSSSISMDRVREEQLFRAFEQKKNHNMPLAFIHLRQGLSAEAIPWIGDTECPEKKVKSESKLPGRQEYKVDPKVQELLSRVRTDLDSFTEVEAYSLMADGYLLSDDELPRVGGKRGEENNASGKKNRPWRFLAVEGWLHRPPEKVYFRHLKVASENLFKPFRLSWPLTTVTLLLPLIMLYFGGRWAWPLLLPELSRSIAIGNVLLAGFLFLFSLAVGIFVPWLARVFKPLQILRSPNEFISRLVVRGLLPALGAVLVRIYLRTVDRLFLKLGRVSR